MTINVCVKNMKTNRLAHIQSPIALLFKDEGGLSNHPLSCHPKGCLAAKKMRENERKEKKKENSRPVLCVSKISRLYNNLSELI